jgi:hypothetical protein
MLLSSKMRKADTDIPQNQQIIKWHIAEIWPDKSQVL